MSLTNVRGRSQLENARRQLATGWLPRPRSAPPFPPFFDSLKADYAEFGEWFKKKATYLHNASSNQCRVSKLRSFSGSIAW